MLKVIVGGSIAIQTTDWAGTGSASANGGEGSPFQAQNAQVDAAGGGGGGGRIAIYYSTQSFNGTVSALGASGLLYEAGPGTIYMKGPLQSVLWVVGGGHKAVVDVSAPEDPAGNEGGGKGVWKRGEGKY